MEETTGPSSSFYAEDLYSPLPEAALPQDTDYQSEGRKKKLWDSHLAESMSFSQRVREGYDDGSKYIGLKKLKRRKKRGRSRAAVSSGFDLAVARCRRRAAKLTSPSPDVTYQTFVPLRDLWMAYAEKLINVSSLSTTNQISAAGKLMKADLHGCPVVVKRSRCPSYVGVSGIIIQETRNIFVLVTPDDQVKRIPKSCSIFAVVLGKCVFSLHGNHLIVKPGERAAKKFKRKATLDL